MTEGRSPIPSAPRRTPRIFVSVAERSADLYAAQFIRAFDSRFGPAEFYGLTGPLTRSVGVHTVHDLTHRSSMLFSAIARVPEALLLLRRLRRDFMRNPPIAAVLVDSPALNLPLAGICKSLQIPVLYYVAPQTWAWREGRVKKIRRRVDRLIAILPFEEDYFRKHQISVCHAGHPLFEWLEQSQADASRVEQYVSDAQPVVVLMPGSRRQVIHEVFPGQLHVAARIRQQFPKARFLLAAADADGEDLARMMATRAQRGGDGPPPDCIVFDHRYRQEMLLAADLALVASGTATLEVAYRATPMIVMYNHGRLIYPLIKAAFALFGRSFIRTRFLSLPNILADREIVPEFMPYYRRIEPIADCAIAMLRDPAGLQARQRELAELIAPLVRTDVSAAVAAELDALIRVGARG
ncbi:MAG: lipid-A-disaccharide synthase [Phycisphaerae bacterium]